jgi:hypothetical protein
MHVLMPRYAAPVALAAINNRLWHIAFKRADGVAEQLVAGREKIFYGYEFTIQGGNLPEDVVDCYVGLVSHVDALPGSFGFYRAWDATMAQSGERASTPLGMPVLAIGGEASWGPAVGDSMTALATDVETAVGAAGVAG